MAFFSLDHLVDRSERFTACWLWNGDFSRDAPIYKSRGRVYSAVRLVWEAVRADILPRDHTLWPTCGHRSCVNPNHQEPLRRGSFAARWIHREKTRVLALFEAAEAPNPHGVLDAQG